MPELGRTRAVAQSSLVGVHATLSASVTPSQSSSSPLSQTSVRPGATPAPPRAGSSRQSSPPQKPSPKPSPSRSRGSLRQPSADSQVSVVQSSPSSQTGGAPGWQPRATSQRSRPLHASASSQRAASGVCVQARSGSSQVSVVQSCGSAHGAVPATQTPSAQRSEPLQ